MAARKPDAETRLADAALKLLAKTPWSGLTLAAVARAAKLPLASLQATLPAKPALLGLLLRKFGAATAAAYRPDKQADMRGRVFDVSMAWFDALAPHRKPIRSLADGLKRDPLTLLAARGDAVAAAQWLLTLAEADTGPLAPLKALGLAAMLARAVPVWLDDGEDLSKTMAQLDGDLMRVERWVGKTERPSP